MYVDSLWISLLSFGGIYILKYYAPKIGLIDTPNARSTHHDSIVTGAGIVFYLSTIIILSFFHSTFVWDNLVIFIAMTFVFVIGVFDDYSAISPLLKFSILIGSTLLLSLDRVMIDSVGFFFGTSVSLGWLGIPFTVFAVVGFSNGLNLIDGIDGLSSVISIVILSMFVFIGYGHHNFFIECISLAFIATLLPFLIFNWYPATIFMGDSGSLMLGFVISIVAIKSLVYLPAVSILYLCAIPIIDTLIVLIRRKLHGRGLCQADRCHIHHIFHEYFKNNTHKTVLFLGSIQLIFSLVGLNFDKNIESIYALILFFVIMIGVYVLLDSMIKKQNRVC